MSTKAGTVLYYAVDRSLEILDDAILPPNIKKAAIVTFTDGLDQGSLMLNTKYETKAAYREAIQQRIKSVKVRDQSIDAYSIGIRRSDVSSSQESQDNLTGLASSAKNAKEVTNMDAVNEQFREIARSLQGGIPFGSPLQSLCKTSDA